MNNINILFGTICTSTSIDQQSNNISLFNLLEQVEFGITLPKGQARPEEIAFPFQFEILTVFATTDNLVADEEVLFEAELTTLDPAGKELGKTPIQGRIEKGKKRSRVVLKSSLIKLTVDGIYIFKIDLFEKKGGDRIAQSLEIPIDVVIKIS